MKKIKILDGRGHFSATSFGKIAVLLAGVALLGFAGTSTVQIIKETKVERAEALQAQIDSGETFGNYIRVVINDIPQNEETTVFIGEDKTPIYLWHDTVADVEERFGYKINWNKSSYRFRDNSYYFSNMEENSIITSVNVDDFIGSSLDLNGYGTIVFTLPNKEELEIEFNTISKLGNTVSEIDLSKCYVTEVSLNSNTKSIETPVKFLDLDNSFTPEKLYDTYGSACRYYPSDDDDVSKSDSAYLYGDGFCFRCYSYEYEEHNSTEINIESELKINTGWNEFMKALGK